MENLNKETETKPCTIQNVSGSTFGKHEAFRKMQEGQKVWHRYMTKNEYLYVLDGGSRVLTEDGYNFTETFWARSIAYYENGWSVYCH
jgi:hypothetical protein